MRRKLDLQQQELNLKDKEADGKNGALARKQWLALASWPGLARYLPVVQRWEVPQF